MPQTPTLFWKLIKGLVLPVLEQFNHQDITLTVVVHPSNFQMDEQETVMRFEMGKHPVRVISTRIQPPDRVTIGLGENAFSLKMEGQLFAEESEET